MRARLILSPSQFKNLTEGETFLWPKRSPRLKLVPDVGEEILQLALHDFSYGVVIILGLEFRIPDESYCILGSSVSHSSSISYVSLILFEERRQLVLPFHINVPNSMTGEIKLFSPVHKQKNCMHLPDLTYEIPLWKQGHTVIGIDEVGRGCLAGPVFVAATCLARGVEMTTDTSRIKKMQKWGIQDSKKISATKRIKLRDIMRGEGVDFAIAATSVATINRVGITHATQIAAKNALNKLITQLQTKSPYILSDAFRINFTSDMGPTPETPIVKGDQKSISIAAASIFAKVARDEYMTELSDKFPDYVWHQNKGYGTKAHQQAILNLGPTIHHRELFINKLVNSAKTA